MSRASSTTRTCGLVSLAMLAHPGPQDVAFTGAPQTQLSQSIAERAGAPTLCDEFSAPRQSFATAGQHSSAAWRDPEGDPYETAYSIWPCLRARRLLSARAWRWRRWNPRRRRPTCTAAARCMDRLPSAFERDFDLNKDGKITKAEFDKALAQRFAEATGGGAAMTEAQFAKAHEKMLQRTQRAECSGASTGTATACFRWTNSVRRCARASRGQTVTAPARSRASVRNASRHEAKGRSAMSGRHWHHRHAGHFRRRPGEDVPRCRSQQRWQASPAPSSTRRSRTSMRQSSRARRP